jgi:hypothetical protein
MICAGKSSFQKSMILEKIANTWADVYLDDYIDDTWYVKFYLENGVILLSCKPDGSNW